MSITFWAPDAPTYEFIPYPEDEPDYVENISVLPEINLSNTNAYAMMEALGETPDYCGTWTVEELPALLERALKLANQEELRAPTTSETVESGRELRRGASEENVVSLTRSCRMVSFGRSDEYVRQKALDFAALFKAAKEGNFSVHWG